MVYIKTNDAKRAVFRWTASANLVVLSQVVLSQKRVGLNNLADK